MVFIGFANVFCSSGRKTLVKPMFLQGRLPKTLVKPMFLHWCLHKTLVLPMFLHGCLHKTLVYQCFPSRGAENIGKNNKNHKNQDLQTLGWRLQILVWQGHLRKTLVKPMFQLTETHKKVGTWGGGTIYIYIYRYRAV